ncbi:MAG TPA: PHB depolymerase family esterase [Oligoflexus sp.]|uniref:alpha/beta hydrolase family esterase n=1 Tax=Oligoflexus sp. TaxID=1971216 RepID=UPI002D7EFBBD|nr:PHB depolymerase family esterase [Oligoflexus sp.]HET9236118.1 PHB depolymerase family esterase [Oligoflexus sp.]
MLRKLILCLGLGSLISASVQAKTFELGGARPAKLVTPFGYSESKSYPLVVFLHGVRSSAEQTDLWLGLTRVNDRQQFLLLMPNGIQDSKGLRFWNATPQCCDDEKTGVDDVAYLSGLIEEAKTRFAVDPSRVYIIGHSNGGYMAYTMACSRPDLLRGIVSIAGSTFETAAECKNPAPLNILQIHGDEDTIVGFEGQGRSPGAFTTTGRWVDINNCQTRTDQTKALDLVRVKWEIDVSRPGPIGLPAIDGGFTDFFGLDFSKETDTYTWTDCTGDSRVGLWKVKGSNHVPSFFGTGVIEKALDFVR